MKFSFENLEVYKKSLDWVSVIEDILDQSPHRTHRILFDQLSRAALSIPLNIAEGNGRWHKADKRQFFWIARGSIYECIPLLEILRSKNLISQKELIASRETLTEISKMLHGLIQSTTTKEPTDTIHPFPETP